MYSLKIVSHLLRTSTDQVQRQIMIKTAIVLNSAEWVSDKLPWKVTVEKPSETQTVKHRYFGFQSWENWSKNLILMAILSDALGRAPIMVTIAGCEKKSL